MSLAAEIMGTLYRDGFVLVRANEPERTPPVVPEDGWYEEDNALTEAGAIEAVKDVICYLDLAGESARQRRYGRGAMLCQACEERIHVG